MRETRQTRPQLESLESMTLLSGVAAAALRHNHHAEVVVINNGPTNPNPGTAITLKGTERGLYSAGQQIPDTGKQYTLFALGRVTPLGSTFTTGSFHAPGFITTGTVDGSLTVRALRGTLTLHLTGTAPGSSSGPFDLTYAITQGSGAFAGNSGTGTVDITVNPFGSASAQPGRSEVGRVTLVFGATPSPTA
jgi:hypothetical protein